MKKRKQNKQRKRCQEDSQQKKENKDAISNLMPKIADKQKTKEKRRWCFLVMVGEDNHGLFIVKLTYNHGLLIARLTFISRACHLTRTF